MSLFKKFGWQISHTSDNEEEDDAVEQNLFSHSNNYLSVAKERAEQEKQRAEKIKAKEERKKIKSETKERKGSVKRESDGGDGRGSSKKSRIDKEESKRLLAKATANFIDLGDSDEDTPCPEPKLEVRRSPRGQPTKDALSLSPAKPKSNLNDIAVNEDEDEFEISQIKKKPAPLPPPEEDDESDPELAELKRKAREKRKEQQHLQRVTINIPSTSPGASEDQSGQYPTPPPSDPVVQLLVTSELPGSEPLIVCRKISQNLGPVRQAWITKQGTSFPAHIAQSLFLTSCGKRLFDSTLVKRLNIAFDQYGRLHLEGDQFREGMVKIHIEAATPELFAKQQEAEKARAKSAVAAATAEPAEDDEAIEETLREPEKQFRITIKAKDKNPFKIKVFPDTLISKILNGARKNLGFDRSQNLYLEFDGDRLEPDDRVADTEIEDMMVLDLYVA